MIRTEIGRFSLVGLLVLAANVAQGATEPPCGAIVKAGSELTLKTSELGQRAQVFFEVMKKHFDPRAVNQTLMWFEGASFEEKTNQFERFLLALSEQPKDHIEGILLTRILFEFRDRSSDSGFNIVLDRMLKTLFLRPGLCLSQLLVEGALIKNAGTTAAESALRSLALSTIVSGFKVGLKRASNHSGDEASNFISTLYGEASRMEQLTEFQIQLDLAIRSAFRYDTKFTSETGDLIEQVKQSLTGTLQRGVFLEYYNQSPFQRILPGIMRHRAHYAEKSGDLKGAVTAKTPAWISPKLKQELMSTTSDEVEAVVWWAVRQNPVFNFLSSSYARLGRPHLEDFNDYQKNWTQKMIFDHLATPGMVAVIGSTINRHLELLKIHYPHSSVEQRFQFSHPSRVNLKERTPERIGAMSLLNVLKQHGAEPSFFEFVGKLEERDILFDPHYVLPYKIRCNKTVFKKFIEQSGPLILAHSTEKNEMQEMFREVGLMRLEVDLKFEKSVSNSAEKVPVRVTNDEDQPHTLFLEKVGTLGPAATAMTMMFMGGDYLLTSDSPLVFAVTKDFSDTLEKRALLGAYGGMVIPFAELSTGTVLLMYPQSLSALQRDYPGKFERSVKMLSTVASPEQALDIYTLLLGGLYMGHM